jgi:hypothetical protein
MIELQLTTDNMSELQLTTNDIGKQFRTRGGKIVTLRRSYWDEDYPFGYNACTVTKEGRWNRAIGESPLDLVSHVGDKTPRAILAPTLQNVLRHLPETAEDRKSAPVVTGCIDYFPLAIAEIARISKAGNDQHNPGQPLHWAREKSTDHVDCIGRHLIERGTFDSDGQRHTAKAAWRALALLQTELETAAYWSPAARS